VKAVYDTIGRIKGTRLKHDEIAEYVGDKNSNLDVSISFFVLCFNFSKRVASSIYVSFYLLYPFIFFAGLFFVQ
jgi:hypothetical protein